MVNHNNVDRIDDFSAVSISLASPEDILSWSSGEVTRPDTVNYRTHRPEKGGLFCERIFGPERDFECSCAKYRGVRYKGMICERCNVQVTHSRVRRKRMGHIDLACPVVHIWFFKGTTSVLAQLLGMKRADVEAVIYYKSHVVIDGGPTGLVRGTLLDDEGLRIERDKHGDAFTAGSGAEAIQAMLAKLDAAAVARELRLKFDELSNRARPPIEERKKLLRRLGTVEALARGPNDPAWMVLRRVPVIPPDLRPVVLLPSGTYASSDLNDLYRRVIQRNMRLKKLLDLNAPEVILRNEKRLLQQAVDALFDNTRTKTPVQGASRRPLKSLADMLKGKQGRFRENLLGKRVDYSGRSVIVVEPALKLHQCGLPKVMALELYQPFVIRQLRSLDDGISIHRARKMIKEREEGVWDALEKVMKGHPVLLNRAPTLHRMGIQAFEPVLVEGNAIRLHPLVCKAFNADFDGDQMAVHLPLSKEAIREAKTRMMATSNVFSPANGQPIITPSKDMVLGCYYLTAERSQPEAQARGVVPIFTGPAEVILAHSMGKVSGHDPIRVRLPHTREVVTDRPETPSRHHPIATTVGRVLFNDVLPAGMPFYDLPCDVRNLSRIVADCQGRLGQKATVELLERIKQLGFREATRSGISFAVADLCEADKEEILADAQAKADRIVSRYEDGNLSAERRGELLAELWEKTTHAVADHLIGELATDAQPGQVINPIFAMFASGARGSKAQIGQLAGMRGAMRRPSGEVTETPIKASFREGLSSLEYFNSTTGARKGLVDTAMKTSDSGYLTRQLVDVAQSVVVTAEDCGTQGGIRKMHTSLLGAGSAACGRVSCETVKHPVTSQVIVRKGDLITPAQAAELDALEVKSITVRSPLTCSARGVCRHCYGVDRSNGALVEMGTAVGVIAGQSIGEPATQLTMRTFHTGGVASVEDITLSLPRVKALFEAHKSKRGAVLAEVSGMVRVGGPKERIRGRRVVFVRPSDEAREVAHVIPPGRRILHESGEVQRGEPLTSGIVNPHDVLRVVGVNAVRQYLVDEIQAVYRSQGIDIDDKHIEVIVSRMLAWVRVADAGETHLLPGQLAQRRDVQAANAELRAGQRPARTIDVLLGIKQAAVRSASFLSAASFQETTKVLTEAALAGVVDPLMGLKENVLLGHLIPVGTGFQAHEEVVAVSS